MYPYGYPSLPLQSVHWGFRLQKRQLTRRNWLEMVQDHSSCKLTKLSDRLPAIEGLARLVQKHTKDEYIEGMWKKDLEEQLTWHVQSAADKGHRPYIAPSLHRSVVVVGLGRWPGPTSSMAR